MSVQVPHVRMEQLVLMYSYLVNQSALPQQYANYLTMSMYVLFPLDVDECASNPCQNGAGCSNLFNQYGCTCTSGWRGINCDIG